MPQTLTEKRLAELEQKISKIQAPASPYLNLSEAAEYANVNRETLKAAWRDGHLRIGHPRDGVYRIHRVDLDNWILSDITDLKEKSDQAVA